PSGLTFNEPLFTRTPPPHDELAAAESVTKASAEAVSIKARLTLPSSYSESHLLLRPSLRCKSKSAMVKVPILIPSLTIKIIFFAVLPLGRVFFWLLAAKRSNGENSDAPTKAKELFLKKDLLFIYNNLKHLKYNNRQRLPIYIRIALIYN